MMIITHESHTDHAGVTLAHLKYLLDLFKDRTGFFIESITFPADFGTLPCGLYGPIVGDDPVPESVVTYGRRGTRQHETRFVDEPMRESHTVTVIAGPDGGGHDCVLYTVYGGPAAPREPGDIAIKSEAERAEAEDFWAEHALSVQS